MDGFYIHVTSDSEEPEKILLSILKEEPQGKIAANFQKKLPPIGVFWDIENCQVPKGKSARALVNNIRTRFFVNHKEAEFLCVCDTTKESKYVIQELNDAQITVIHISGTSKNGADEKLKQCMRRFVNTYKPPATVILISGDINFATDLSDFKHRYHIHIVLIHSNRAKPALLESANEHYHFSEFIANLPCSSPLEVPIDLPVDVLVSFLPIKGKTIHLIKKRLQRLSDNCGGRVLQVSKQQAIIRFRNMDTAERAQQRMNRELVYGQTISVDMVNGFGNKTLMKETFNNPFIPAEQNSSSGHESSLSESCDNEKSLKELNTFKFPPPPVLDEYNSPTILKVTPNSFLNKSPYPNHTVKRQHMKDKMPKTTSNRANFANGMAHQNNTYLHCAQETDSSCKLNGQRKSVGRLSPCVMHENGSLPWLPDDSHNIELRSVIKHNINSYVKPPSKSNYQGFPSLAQGINVNINPLHLQPEFQIHKSPLMLNNLPCSTSCINGSSPISHANSDCAPVELLISNLDQNIDAIEMKNILQSMFREIVMILHISMLIQPDGSRKAMIKVPSQQDAQLVISHFQKRKIGHKRIIISNVNGDGPPFPFIKKMDYRTGSSSSNSESSQEFVPLEKSYCERHCVKLKSRGWAEQDNVHPIPDVFMSLKTLSPAVHKLLDSHYGSLPLSTFCICYEAEIGLLPVINHLTEESKLSNMLGVPLEHLITCVAGVEIAVSCYVKKVQWCENKALSQGALFHCISPVLAGPLALFSREIVDLLKSQPLCIIPFNKFIPIYHHHFGRQCRVADYGFTRLIELLASLPHIVQVLGEGQGRIVTLTHRMQVKRFTADLLRILKSRPNKQMLLSEFPGFYEQSFEKTFSITNYCVCDINDVLSQISENQIQVVTHDNEVVLSIPKRDQTEEEITRMQQFSTEVIQLLKHTPTFSMNFNKFIPSYHHHFGKQCRVADYGFTKLLELFETLPIIEIKGLGEDKILYLVEKVRNKLLVDRLTAVLKSQSDNMIALSALESAYTKIHGHLLNPSDFGALDLPDLLKKLNSSLKIVEGYAGSIVTLVDQGYIRELGMRICRILMESPHGKMSIQEMNQIYQKRFGHSMDFSSFQQEISEYVKINNEDISLAPIRCLARDILILLYECNGQILYSDFENAFEKRFAVKLQPATFGYASLNALLYALSDYVQLQGRKDKRLISISRQVCRSPLPFMSRRNFNLSYNDLFRFNGPYNSFLDLGTFPLFTRNKVGKTSFTDTCPQNSCNVNNVAAPQMGFLTALNVIPSSSNYYSTSYSSHSSPIPIFPQTNTGCPSVFLNSRCQTLSATPTYIANDSFLYQSQHFMPFFQKPELKLDKFFFSTEPHFNNTRTNNLENSSANSSTGKTNQVRSRIAAQFTNPLHLENP